MRQLGLDIKDGGNLARIIFPRVQLADKGDLQFQRSAAAPFDITFAALETGGALAKKLVRLDGPIVATAASARRATTTRSTTVTAGV
jgi:hypothetical protein